jgi:hypothetical protein
VHLVGRKHGIRPPRDRLSSGCLGAPVYLIFKRQLKLAQAAQKHWRRLNKHELIVHVVQGKVFTDGVMQNAA